MRVRSFLPLVVAGAALWYVRSVYRFRDPVRLPRVGPGEVLSPADGTVSFVRRVQGAQADGVNVAGLLNVPEAADGWLIGILVGPLDAHYVYQPVAGQVARVTHRAAPVNVPLLGAGAAAGFLAGRVSDLLGARGTLENDRLTSVTVTPFGDVTVTLVAPGAGLRVTAYQQAGDAGRAGFKAAFLEEGGLVLLHLPAAFTPVVGVGERVLGAHTVAARADN
ncbi:phosphatidylserine decarboxylase [Deinococcus depolymerans]|uniref:Phosphatidylserine decarboxylase n=1 Tax=Deinococcus depolymerans TaxID=392408 RepID=A0ABP3LS61_9DEIO